MTPEFITDTVLEWFETLDYEYMVLHVVVCYGLYFSDNLRWIVEYLSPVRKKGITKAVWLVGGILALLELARFFPYMGEGLTHEKVFSVLHSYIFIQVFVGPIVKGVHNWLEIFKKKKNINTTDE